MAAKKTEETIIIFICSRSCKFVYTEFIENLKLNWPLASWNNIWGYGRASKAIKIYFYVDK